MVAAIIWNSDAINIQVLIKLTPSGVGMFPLISLFSKINKWVFIHLRDTYFLILLWHRHFHHLAVGSARRCVVQSFAPQSDSELGGEWTPSAATPSEPDKVLPQQRGGSASSHLSLRKN